MAHQHQIGHAQKEPMANEGRIGLAELSHSLGTANASPTERLFRQLTQKPTSGRASALGLDINRSEQLVG